MAKITDPVPPGDDELPPAPEPADADPFNDLQRWRRRALEAEALVEQLTKEAAALRDQLTALERARTLDALLAEAGAIDVGAARAVLEARLAQSPQDAPADLPGAVADLRRALPFLFSAPPRPAPPAHSAMSPAQPVAPASSDLDEALELAATTGDRAALLRYLRLRRAV